jgi:hypothetical protein
MTNRVTDQTTQNALIAKFRMEGVLPEMEVSPTIAPVVLVATLSEALNISEFEKWRSVFNGPPYIDPNDTEVEGTGPFLLNTNNISAETNHYAGDTGFTSPSKFGCAIPGAAVGQNALDGVYRVTVWCSGHNGNFTIIEGRLVQTPAYGSSVAASTFRKSIFKTESRTEDGGGGPIIDILIPILKTDLANAVELKSTSATSTGIGCAQITVQKIISEIPPSPLFP